MTAFTQASTTFIFPSDHFKISMPDEMFKEQAVAISNAGFNNFCVNINEISSLNNLPFDLSGQLVVYRGWMLNGADYEKLNSLVRSANGHLFTSPEKYLLAHYLPNWYSKIEDLSPKTKIFEYNDDWKKIYQI